MCNTCPNQRNLPSWKIFGVVFFEMVFSSKFLTFTNVATSSNPNDTVQGSVIENIQPTRMSIHYRGSKTELMASRHSPNNLSTSTVYFVTPPLVQSDVLHCSFEYSRVHLRYTAFEFSKTADNSLLGYHLTSCSNRMASAFSTTIRTLKLQTTCRVELPLSPVRAVQDAYVPYIRTSTQDRKCDLVYTVLLHLPDRRLRPENLQNHPP